MLGQKCTYIIPAQKKSSGGGGVITGGCGWGRQSSSADMSQLHAWLAMLTLALTRQRGDTSRRCRGLAADTLLHMQGVYTHMHSQ